MAWVPTCVLCVRAPQNLNKSKEQLSSFEDRLKSASVELQKTQMDLLAKQGAVLPPAAAGPCAMNRVKRDGVPAVHVGCAAPAHDVRPAAMLTGECAGIEEQLAERDTELAAAREENRRLEVDGEGLRHSVECLTAEQARLAGACVTD